VRREEGGGERRGEEWEGGVRREEGGRRGEEWGGGGRREEGV
jgi:hypothetical protein